MSGSHPACCTLAGPPPSRLCLNTMRFASNTKALPKCVCRALWNLIGFKPNCILSDVWSPPEATWRVKQGSNFISSIQVTTLAHIVIFPAILKLSNKSGVCPLLAFFPNMLATQGQRQGIGSVLWVDAVAPHVPQASGSFHPRGYSIQSRCDSSSHSGCGS